MYLNKFSKIEIDETWNSPTRGWVWSVGAGATACLVVTRWKKQWLRKISRIGSWGKVATEWRTVATTHQLSTKATIARTMINRHPQIAESATMRFCFSSQSMRLQRRKVVWIECWHRSTEFGKVSSDQAGFLPVLQSNVQLGRCTLSFTVCNLTRVFRSRGCQER